MDSSTKESLLWLAWIFLQYEEDEKSLTLLQAVQEFFPEDTDCAAMLAWLHLKKANYTEALTQVENWKKYSVQSAPESLHVANWICECARKKQANEKKPESD